MAKWIRANSTKCLYGNAYRMCSDCKEVVYMPLDYKFCPMCGITMENLRVEIIMCLSMKMLRNKTKHKTDGLEDYPPVKVTLTYPK